MEIDTVAATARHGDTVLLRYRYRDASVQAALPMRAVQDTGDCLVAWLSPGSQIMYWALPDGTDPRRLPVTERFDAPLSTARRTWQGGGTLRVIPIEQSYQVLHFWDGHGQFKGWYINLEAPKTRSGIQLDTIDWHLDLWIDADRVPTWKDTDEAEAAVAAGQLTTDELAQSWEQGRNIIDHLAAWPDVIGDWRTFTAPAAWGALDLPSDWAD